MYRVLFVCMSNICRSPTAEAVFRSLLLREKLDKQIEVDSAATHGYHVGEEPDTRARQAALQRGYDLSQIRARKIRRHDMSRNDLIVGMDVSDVDYLSRMRTPGDLSQLELFMDYSCNFMERDVPDPYYALGFDFDLVLDMIEDSAEGLLMHLKRNVPLLAHEEEHGSTSESTGNNRNLQSTKAASGTEKKQKKRKFTTNGIKDDAGR